MMDTVNRHRAIRKRRKWLGIFFLLGLFLFMYRILFSSEKIELSIPVELVNLPNSLVLTQRPAREIELLLEGPKYRVNNLADVDSRYVVDLSDASQGINRIPVQQDGFQFSRAFRIERIIPATLTLKAESAMIKEVPVMVAVSGKPAAGFIFVDAVARPSSVVLKGPEDFLGSIEKVMTQPIDINGLSEGYKKQITLDLDEMLEVAAPTGLFLAEIFIEKKVITKTFDNIPVKGRDSVFQYRIKPDSICMEISGPENILEKLDAGKNINVYVDLKDLKPGIYVKPAVITLPLETMLISVDTEIFTVAIH